MGLDEIDSLIRFYLSVKAGRAVTQEVIKISSLLQMSCSSHTLPWLELPKPSSNVLKIREIQGHGCLLSRNLTSMAYSKRNSRIMLNLCLMLFLKHILASSDMLIATMLLYFVFKLFIIIFPLHNKLISNSSQIVQRQKIT